MERSSKGHQRGNQTFFGYFTSKGDGDYNVEAAFPGYCEEAPGIWMDGQNLECPGDNCFSRPSAMAGKTEEVDRMGSAGVMHGKIWAEDKTVDAWCGCAMGERAVYDEPIFSRVLFCGDDNGADTVDGGGRKWTGM